MTVWVAPDYATLIRQVGEDQTEFAYIGPAPYVAMVERYGQKRLLGRLAVNGSPSYRGVVVVRAESPFQTLEALKGMRMGFVNRSSTMGYLVPVYLLHQAGVALTDLKDAVFVGGHRNVALGVLMGTFEAGAVKDEVFEAYRSQGLRALAETPLISEQAFLATRRVPADLAEKTQTALAELGRRPDGVRTLSAITSNVTAFAPVADSDYDELRVILAQLKRLGLWEAGR